MYVVVEFLVGLRRVVVHGPYDDKDAAEKAARLLPWSRATTGAVAAEVERPDAGA